MTAATNAAAARDAELTSLNRPVRLGFLACLAGLICIGGLIAAFGVGSDRAAGAAERWLVALADSTREGLRDDAEDRLIDLGGGDAGRFLVPPEAAEDEERAFEDLRVGRDTDPADDRAVVPYELRQYEVDDAVFGVVVLDRVDDDWRVVGVEERGPLTIQRPERPGLPVWLGTIALGILICIGCAAATRAATPKDEPETSA